MTDGSRFVTTNTIKLRRTNGVGRAGGGGV